jgi:hypothetical protein
MTPSKSAAEISAEMLLFSVWSFSVLVDDATDAAMIETIPQAGVTGYYTFTAATAGRKIGDATVQLLPALERLPDSGAWLVASTSKAGYALNEWLGKHGREGDLVFTLAKARVAAIYSYVDFFHGETETVAYITNNFERGYKIHFPIAVRFLLRSQTGEVLKAWQRMIAPNQTIAIDSREMDLTEPLFGYLEAYTDIRHVNGEVSPFLHFNCDYISADGIATIHQSGFKPWPAGSRFERGIVPVDGRSQLTISLFNKPNDVPVICRAELRFTRNGQRVTASRDLPPVARDHMVLVDINEVFADELARGAEAADVIIVPNQPMHRPNFYLHPRGRRWSWTAVEHGAATTARILPREQRHRIAELGAHPWICAFPILPERFGIDTTVIYFQEGEAALHDFTFELHDRLGATLHTEDVHCAFGRQINVSDWARTRSIPLNGGLLTVSPAANVANVPSGFSFLEGFQPRDNPHRSVVVSGAGMLNVPYEWEQSWMWNHPMVPTVHTEQFGKAVVNEAFDTLVTLSNASAMLNDDRAADLDFDVYAEDGSMAHFRMRIAPNSSLTFSIRELLRGSDLPGTGHYALWIYCRDRQVQGFHILQRNSDHAIGVQHFYYCRFNTLEKDEPSRRQQVLPASRRARLVQVAHAVRNKAHLALRQLV